MGSLWIACSTMFHALLKGGMFHVKHVRVVAIGDRNCILVALRDQRERAHQLVAT